MLNAVRTRFDAMGLPSFPGEQLLLFWGGRRLGFDGFEHNPAEYASRVQSPTLLLAGAADRRATPEQVYAPHDRLAGRKRIRILGGAGHEPIRAR